MSNELAPLVISRKAHKFQWVLTESVAFYGCERFSVGWIQSDLHLVSRILPHTGEWMHLFIFECIYFPKEGLRYWLWKRKFTVRAPVRLTWRTKKNKDIGRISKRNLNARLIQKVMQTAHGQAVSKLWNDTQAVEGSDFISSFVPGITDHLKSPPHIPPPDWSYGSSSGTTGRQGNGSQQEKTVPCGEHVVMPWHSVGYGNWWRGCYWVETGDNAEHPTMYETDAHDRELCNPKCQQRQGGETLH